MNIRLVPALLAAASLLLASCLPESKNPLSTPSTSTVDGRLGGVYVQKREKKDDDLSTWHFHYRETNVRGRISVTPWLEVLNLEHRRGDGLKGTTYRALTTHLGVHDYISFMEVGDAVSKDHASLYGFARYEVNWSGDIQVWFANSDFLAQAIKSGKLHGTVRSDSTGKNVLLTDSTERLAAFVAASDPARLFGGKPLIFYRLTR
ncbi:hypothetical protein CfE428DRAFT_4277 [Chthoniobacter flavus Ellin428]|uniref:Lipoprotein n=1 Tax=Chthoniobacter flavus Ellin428 TaxID=497964 RepID=B4D5T8_9BACT|nr:hypothetical protein [Chthoniobacter flavus]EDY18141.1 hypothetical protein CfE428DRAFT_4277 [Chthoniobacter flavus Ellin428]TCO91504.1 hypothetical protein EV701_108232 [Chthoniobacter flavus]